MSTLHFLNYNNYQNRTLKGEALTSVSSYTVAKSYSGINFNINDGINTTQVINDSTLLQFNYDYCLVTDDNSNTITSKWFVHDAVWNRKHQWIIPLLRDVKADFYDMYKNKPFFCMKGLPADANDILCFNSEGKQYNQILRNRVALKQTSGQTGRYIIGFVDKKWAGGDIPEYKYDFYYEKMEDLPIYQYLQTMTWTEPNYTFVQMYAVDAPDPGSQDFATGTQYEVFVPTGGTLLAPSIIAEEGSSAAGSLGKSGLTIANMQNAAYAAKSAAPFSGLASVLKERFKSYYDDIANDWFTMVSGKKVKVGDQIYTFSIGNSQGSGYLIDADAVPNGTKNGCAKTFKNKLGSSAWYSSRAIDAGNVACGGGGIKYTNYDINMTEVTTETTHFTVPTSGITEGLPYNIFYMADSDAARQFAGWFASKYGATFLYDLQLFPYAPIQANATPITTSNGVTVYWAKSDSRFGTCSHSAIASYSSMADKKVGANQDTCRIISPNGASAWEFNPAAIGGVGADSIKYEFTLIPFNSYLHIFPYFGGIYGGINKVSGDKEAETRGLVCTGPWSFPYSTNNWSTYQLNNSAYMDSFNRQIQNMTTMQDIEKTKEAANIILGSIQGGVSGAVSGSLMSGGNPVGAVAGAAVGTLASAAGGMLDQYLNSEARKETINYTKDQFQYSLQNIKAQAQPLAHNSSITIGNSYWPIVELYKADIGTTPTPMRDYFLEDLKIHGWSMGITTTFATMKGRVSSNSRYISGYLLQVENAEDTHIANEIMKELNKGVYIDHV